MSLDRISPISFLFPGESILHWKNLWESSKSVNFLTKQNKIAVTWVAVMHRVELSISYSVTVSIILSELKKETWKWLSDCTYLYINDTNELLWKLGKYELHGITFSSSSWDQ